ncbi:MAG: NHL repeat-containing protein [Planctomycetes bacterium]|nr:NHL repeat-containing protein [Planctomycetota bacterium]
MSGGVAVRANLLCVSWSAGQGHVFLFDLEARQRMSAWSLPPGQRGYSDAAGVAMDEHFHLFVADPHNDRVCHFSAFGRHLGDFGLPAPETGDVGRDRPGILDRPHAVAHFGDTVYVACGDRPRRRSVQRFSRRGEVQRPLASGGDIEAVFGAPRAVFADATGVLVADTLHGCIQRFRLDGTFLAKVNCGPAGQLARPVAVLRLSNGDLLFADRGDQPGVRRLRPDGARVAMPDDVDERCHDPQALASDERGRIYVLDRGGERVQRFGADLIFDCVVVDLAEHLLDYEPGVP